MNRAKLYHVNPLCNKWLQRGREFSWIACREEDNIKKNMERRIRSAKSSIPTGAKRTGSAGSRTRGKQVPASAGQQRPSLGGIDQQLQELMPGVDLRVLDDLIAQRLQQVLGQPLVQRIQQHAQQQRQQQHHHQGEYSYINQAYSPPPQQASPGMSKVARQAITGKGRIASAKPAQPRARPAWNDDWAAPGPTLPLCAGAFPMPKTKSSPASKGSPSHLPLPHSPQPASHATTTTKPGIRVQLLPTHDSTNQSRPCSSTRYANDTLLTESHVAAIAALNPSRPSKVPALQAKPPRPSQSSAYDEAAAQHAPSSFAPTTPTCEAGLGTTLRPPSCQAYQEEVGMMSLSRLSSAQRSPYRQPHPSLCSRPSKQPPQASATLSTAAVQGSADELDSGSNDIDVHHWSRAVTGRRAACSYEGSEYDDDEFEVYEDDGDSSADDAAVPATQQGQHAEEGAHHDAQLLQQSVSELNALLQLKIQAVMRASRAASVTANRASVVIQQQAAGLNSTLGVMGGNAQFGVSSDLLTEQPLRSADLAYLDLHPGDDQDTDVQFEQIDLPEWACDKEGAWYEATTVEPGLPLGTGCEQHDAAAGGEQQPGNMHSSGQHESTEAGRVDLPGLGTMHGHVLQEDDVLIGTCPDFQSATDHQRAMTAAAQLMSNLVSSSQHVHSDSGSAEPWTRPGDSRTWISLPDLLAGKAISRVNSGRQAEQEPGRQQGSWEDAQPLSTTLPTGGTLAGQVLALWDSLRQLNDLMSGPRGAELSPGRKQFQGQGGFQLPGGSPCCTPTKSAPQLSDEQEACAAHETHQSPDQETREADQQGRSTEAGEQQQLLAGLMHTVSRSLGDEELLQGMFAVHMKDST